MTDLVSQYIKKGLHSLYYAFYVIIEGIFKVSHSWNPIISIAGIISLLVALPLINIIRLLFLCWMDLDIPVNTATIICIIIWNGLYWLHIIIIFLHTKILNKNFKKIVCCPKQFLGCLRLQSFVYQSTSIVGYQSFI